MNLYYIAAIGVLFIAGGTYLVFYAGQVSTEKHEQASAARDAITHKLGGEALAKLDELLGNSSDDIRAMDASQEASVMEILQAQGIASAITERDRAQDENRLLRELSTYGIPTRIIVSLTYEERILLERLLIGQQEWMNGNDILASVEDYLGLKYIPGYAEARVKEKAQIPLTTEERLRLFQVWSEAGASKALRGIFRLRQMGLVEFHPPEEDNITPTVRIKATMPALRPKELAQAAEQIAMNMEPEERIWVWIGTRFGEKWLDTSLDSRISEQLHDRSMSISGTYLVSLAKKGVLRHDPESTSYCFTRLGREVVSSVVTAGGGIGDERLDGFILAEDK